jgi:hypothetical protein
MKRPRMIQDFKDLLSAFNAHGVKYLIMGSTKAGGDHVGAFRFRRKLKNSAICGFCR